MVDIDDDPLALDEFDVATGLEPDGSDLEDEASDAEREAEALIAFTEQERLRADAAEAKFAEQMREADRLSKWHQADPAPLTTMEEAAQKAAFLSGDEIAAFKQRLADANAELAARFRGEDAARMPEPAAEPFNANALPRDVFGALARAGARGGVDLRDVPSGYSNDSWTTYVNERIGR